MFQKLLAMFPLIIQALSISLAKRAIDAALDVIEDSIKASPTQVDDNFIQRIINLIRTLAKIPDNDKGEPILVRSDGKVIKREEVTFFDRIKSLLSVLMANINFDLAKKAVDAALDVVEDEIEGSKTKLDDFFLLPSIAIVRAICKIPDNDTDNNRFGGDIAPNSK